MTKTHSSFRFEMDDMVLEIENLSKHLFIEKYVTVPEPAFLRLQLLNIFLYYVSVPQDLRKSYGVTAGLIQMGLDVHESVTTQKENSVNKVRGRQLSILAGDYYSSIYYFLLSKKNLIEGVKKFSKGIRNINIAKMNLYTENSGQGFDSIQQYIQLLKVRESNLYTQFLDELQSQKEKENWRTIIEDMIFLLYVAEELQANEINQHHYSYYLINHYASKDEKEEIMTFSLSTDKQMKYKKLFHKYKIQRKIEEMMQSIYVRLNQMINDLEDPFIKTELYFILNHYTQTLQNSEYNKEDLLQKKAPANI